MSLERVPIDAVAPSTYNPRQADEDRLGLVELSLSTLGFIHPIVADKGGEIISGHQRQLVARRLGMTEIPVLFVDCPELEARKAMNIVFNRGTNDMKAADEPADLRAAMHELDPVRLAGELEPPEDMMRCLSAVDAPVAPYAAQVRSRYDRHMRNLADTLRRRLGVSLPVIVTESGAVVNGVGRIQLAQEKGFETVPVVTISDAEAKFAGAMVNLLSMDFDIHVRYADLLRFNSFRRASLNRKHLGRGFVFAIKIDPTKFDIYDPTDRLRWKRKYGESVVDFGAGLLGETEMLRENGVHCIPFEPFSCTPGTNDLDLERSRKLTREFLEDVASGRHYSSVFASQVFNSIPFEDDRKHVLQILAALCTPGESTMYLTTRALNHSTIRGVQSDQVGNATHDSSRQFLLSYESGITLGDYMDKPKTQKFYGLQEMHDLCHTAFQKVNVKGSGGDLMARARRTEPIDWSKLQPALEFEFDLPHPGGERLGMVREAVEAFRERDAALSP